MVQTCAFSGHRVLTDLDTNLLDRVLLNLIKNGCGRFLCGMARGFDMTAAESVIALKKEYPHIELVACIPCEDQSSVMSARDRERYFRILSLCSEKIVLTDRYFNGCMQARDRFMVDNSDLLLCYLRRSYGGTYYTVGYAKKCDKKIIEL